MNKANLEEQGLEPSDVDVARQLHGAEADPVVIVAGWDNATLP